MDGGRPLDFGGNNLTELLRQTADVVCLIKSDRRRGHDDVNADHQGRDIKVFEVVGLSHEGRELRDDGF